MIIIQSNFFELLSGVKQYQVPIYQRNYAWGDKECKRLLEDIVKCGTPGSPNHYIGSVIVKDEAARGGVNLFNVIDGQQRTTTISLLLLALENYYRENPVDELPNETKTILNNLKNIYLVNQAFINTGLYSKLLLKQSDRNEFDNLLHDVVGNGQLSKNYNYFLSALNKNNYNPEIIFNGINNAQLALVTLVNNENPQLLFEAVNDTGKELSQVDKVRNWVFMGLPSVDQERLYRGYWQNMEDSLGDNLNSFLRYYTLIKVAKQFGNEYYPVFKDKFILRVGTTNLTEELLQEISCYAVLYSEFINCNFNSQRINNQLQYIRDTRKENFTPVILKIMKNNEGGLISENDTVMMLRYIESYIVRRDLMNIPTNSLNPAMINMLNNCDSLTELQNSINGLPDRQYMPTDIELHTQLKTRDFYGLSSAYYYLERIEKSVNQAFALDDATIEHIMPETMHTTANPKNGVNNQDDYNWELDLGNDAIRIHNTYLHTLGNLTILPRGENARMGDYRFDIKKNWPNAANNGFNYGYMHTPIRISQSLRNVAIWNETSILSRCDEMVNLICNIWPHP